GGGGGGGGGGEGGWGGGRGGGGGGGWGGKPADRARGDLQHERRARSPLSVKPELGMDRAFGQAESLRRRRGTRAHGRLRHLRQARRRDVDRLLEERSVEWIRLVEQGQCFELAPNEQAFERDLLTRDERLDQETIHAVSYLADIMRRENGGDALPCGDEFSFVVGADDTTAGGEHERLQ